MGIIQKQTIRGTIYAYAGVGIGFITTVLIYPKIFSTDEIGLLRLLVAYSTLFAQFATLGFTRVATMMFPYFRDYKKNHNGFFFLTFAVGLAGFFLSLAILYLFKPMILGSGFEKSELFATYFVYIVPLIFFSLVFLMLDNYYKVLYNSVQGTFLKEFAQRVLILAASLLFLAGLVSFRDYVWLFLVAFFIPAAALLVMLMRDKQLSLKPNPAFITRELKKRMINVSFYGILTGFSGLLVLNIDSIMINAMMDLSSTGIYAITFFFGTVILIPSRSLLKISSVVIADSWKVNDLGNINTIYFKSCINQFALASLLFIGIWANIHNIFKLLPPEYEAGKYVIFFISLSSVIQMAGGTSNMILFTSPRFRMHTWFMIVLVVLLVVSNLIFIPIYGITGAAIASAIAFLLYNLLKFIYLQRTYNFNPYNYKSVLVLLITIATFEIQAFLPVLEPFWVDIFVRSLIISVFFLGFMWIFNISDEVNKSLLSIVRYLTGKRK